MAEKPLRPRLIAHRCTAVDRVAIPWRVCTHRGPLRQRLRDPLDVRQHRVLVRQHLRGRRGAAVTAHRPRAGCDREATPCQPTARRAGSTAPRVWLDPPPPPPPRSTSRSRVAGADACRQEMHDAAPPSPLPPPLPSLPSFLPSLPSLPPFPPAPLPLPDLGDQADVERGLRREDLRQQVELPRLRPAPRASRSAAPPPRKNAARRAGGAAPQCGGGGAPWPSRRAAAGSRCPRSRLAVGGGVTSLPPLLYTPFVILQSPYKTNALQQGRQNDRDTRAPRANAPVSPTLTNAVVNFAPATAARGPKQPGRVHHYGRYSSTGYTHDAPDVAGAQRSRGESSSGRGPTIKPP
jgi:hypothetical protein